MNQFIYIHLTFVLFLLNHFSQALEFDKNINIHNSPKLGENRTIEVTYLQHLQKILKKNDYVIIMYYAGWCNHW